MRIKYVRTLQNFTGIRKISDRTRSFLAWLKDQCSTALRTPNSKRQKVLEAINIDESILESVYEKTQAPGGLIEMLVRSIDAMIEVRISCEYGDFVSYGCKELKTNDMRDMIWRQQGNEGKNWQEINALLEAEEDATGDYHDQRRRGLLLDRPETPWSESIAIAAQRLQIDVAVVRYEITAYASRNFLCHNGVEKLIENCDWQELAHRILWDKQNLNRFFRNDPQAQIRMRLILGRIQDQFFETCFWQGGQVVWVPTDLAVRRMIARAGRLATP
ncbi:MAG: hypothetical protein LQ343_005587 [Gyalolechia ehrenbergii]|nr:MAG: hypothetical protein LQ343_005587 [Gyalolechia ehrenbergii]